MSSANKCHKRSAVLGAKGKCCCNCAMHLSLRSHPWVDGKSMSNRLGHVCSCFADERVAVVSSGHGLCEMWTTVAYLAVPGAPIP